MVIARWDLVDEYRSILLSATPMPGLIPNNFDRLMRP